MAQRSVVWTSIAELQFSGILEYWVERTKSAVYAKKLLHAVTERTNQIAINPYIYKATDFPETRVASLGNFSIFYKFTPTQIIITSFWDNRQSPDSLRKLLGG